MIEKKFIWILEENEITTLYEEMEIYINSPYAIVALLSLQNIVDVL
jgi:hypothetical protein